MIKALDITVKTTIKKRGGGFLNAASLEAAIDKKLAEVFPPFCERIINQRINERPDEPYLLNIDGRVIDPPNLTQLQNARKNVKLVFIFQQLAIAINEFRQILENSYRTNAARFSGPKGGGLLKDYTDADVLMFYGGIGKPDKKINSSNDVRNFERGDYILITSNNPWQMYLNTKGKARRSLRVRPLKQDIPGFKGGFFGLAAKRIRAKLGINTLRNQSRAPIQVLAVRSRAVMRHLNPPQGLSPEGLRNWAELRYLGAWAIMIRRNRR